MSNLAFFKDDLIYSIGLLRNSTAVIARPRFREGDLAIQIVPPGFPLSRE